MLVRSPRLKIEWEPRWRGFLGSVAIVCSRPRHPLARLRIVRLGARPKIPLTSILCHLLALSTFLTFGPKLADLLPSSITVQMPSIPDRSEPIYYFVGGLPAVRDAGGAEAGTSGRSGGHELKARQTIRVTRGRDLASRVVDTRTLRLHRTKAPVTNLVGIGPAPQLRPKTNLKSLASLVRHIVAPPLSPEDQDMDLAAENRVRPGAQAENPAPNAGAPPVLPSAKKTELPSALAHLPAAPPVSLAPQPEIRPVMRASSLPRTTGAPPALPAGKKTELPSALAHLPAASAVSLAPQPEIRPVMRASSAPRTAGAPPALPAGIKADLPSAVTSLPNALPVRPSISSDLRASDIMVSAEPGSSVASPEKVRGAIAMQPRGDGVAGTGGKAGGTGTSLDSAWRGGNGAGSPTANSGVGRNAPEGGGISSSPGPGGAGAGNNRNTGVAINGPVVHLPSFASSAGMPQPIRGPRQQSRPNDVVIIASARAGGGLSPDLAPPGARVYTIYVQTAAGTAVLQYADPSTSSYDYALSAPQPITTDMPGSMKVARTIVACVLDRVGELHNARVLQATNADLASKVLVALAKWRFQPVLRGGDPVEVKAVIGFGVDTQ